MEEPQPVAPSGDGAAAAAQPVVDSTLAAASPQQPMTPSQPAQVDETAAWLESKGLNRDDPEYMDKLTKMAYNSEKQMTKAAQEAAELRKLFPSSQQPMQPQPGDDPNMAALGGFVQEWRQEKMLQQFKESHQDWSQYRTQMSDLLGGQIATPQGVFSREELVTAGIMSLDDIYAIAKGSTPVDTSNIRQQAQQEVLQNLANTQRAGGSAGDAVNSNPQAPQVDPVLEGIKRSRGQ